MFLAISIWKAINVETLSIVEGLRDKKNTKKQAFNKMLNCFNGDVYTVLPTIAG